MNKIVYLVIILAVIVLGFVLIDRDKDAVIVDDSFTKQFMDEIILRGVEKIGQPIEGFDSFLLMRAFSDLVASDFEGVQTIEGRYEIVKGEIEFRHDKDQPISSAEKTVSNEGYGKLLKNISERLEIDIESKESVNQILEKISGENLAVFRCADNQGNVDACIEIYQPVCANINVQCVTSPCEPVFETISNSCFACMNELVQSYTLSECR